MRLRGGVLLTSFTQTPPWLSRTLRLSRYPRCHVSHRPLTARSAMLYHHAPRAAHLSVTCACAASGAQAHARARRARLERAHRVEHVARVAEGGGLCLVSLCISPPKQLGLKKKNEPSEPKKRGRPRKEKKVSTTPTSDDLIASLVESVKREETNENNK